MGLVLAGPGLFEQIVVDGGVLGHPLSQPGLFNVHVEPLEGFIDFGILFQKPVNVGPFTIRIDDNSCIFRIGPESQAGDLCIAFGQGSWGLTSLFFSLGFSLMTEMISASDSALI